MSDYKICVVTGTRAEYGLFHPIMKVIEASEKLRLQLVVTTMHLCPEFGLTYKRIEEDGFKIDEKVENLFCSDTKSSIAKSTGMATLLLSDVYRRLEPDMVLLLGDRYETLASATAALLMNIPIGHIHGGEITEGAIDEQIRHAITKMSHLHFTSTEEYRRRVIQMGEHPDNVYNTGAPGIDNIVHTELLSRDELSKSIRWSLDTPYALFTYHPETLSDIPVDFQIETILDQLETMDMRVLFTYANADENGHIINRAIEALCQKNPDKYRVVKNLGHRRYLSAMKYATLLIGNTSSGIIEAASFKKPVVNIGNRQKGRLQSGNVLNCKFDSIKYSVREALSEAFRRKCEAVENVYGKGDASRKIVDIIMKKLPISPKKEFYNFNISGRYSE